MISFCKILLSWDRTQDYTNSQKINVNMNQSITEYNGSDFNFKCVTKTHKARKERLYILILLLFEHQNFFEQRSS